MSEKLAIVRQFLDSGLSLKLFAESECINPDTFKSWVEKYREGSLQYKKSTKRDESEKLALVDSFLASGLPMKTFADSEGINHSTFRYWVRKYREGTLSK